MRWGGGKFPACPEAETEKMLGGKQWNHRNGGGNGSTAGIHWEHWRGGGPSAILGALEKHQDYVGGGALIPRPPRSPAPPPPLGGSPGPKRKEPEVPGAALPWRHRLFRPSPPPPRGADAPRVAGFIADVIGAAQPIPCRGGKGAAARPDPPLHPPPQHTRGHALFQDGGVGGACRWGRSGSSSVVQKVPQRGRGPQVRPLWARLGDPGGPAATMAAGSECCGPLLPWVRGGRDSPRHEISPELCHPSW